jgi:sodium/bile acid cotransporter 7
MPLDSSRKANPLKLMPRVKRLRGSFTLALLATVIAASLLPCRGQTAITVNLIANIAIGLLFFLHGARLSREATVAGATHWRLHLVVLLSTFLLFPLLGFALKPVLAPLVTPALYTGVLFLCTLPSTVQSSIAFTSIAKGNVPAAVCSASASSLIGIFLTPVIVSVTIANRNAGASSSLDGIWDIVMQLLIPFIAGQLLRPWIAGLLERGVPALRYLDQGSILLIVYTAFSEAVNEGLWHRTPVAALGGLAVVDIVLLVVALLVTSVAARRLGFSKADQITAVFCGSKKSLASGIPMAKVLFSGHALGAVVLPLMLFHQIQLMVCSVLAQRWHARSTCGEGMPHVTSEPADVDVG